MLYRIFRIIFIAALVIALLIYCAHLHMRSIQRSAEYANYVYLTKIYREYSSNGFLKHKDIYRGDAFIYTNPIMVYGTNFFPVIGIRFFVNDNDSEIYLINNNENVILINKDSIIKFLNFKYND